MSYHDLYYQDDGWPPINAAAFVEQVYRALKPGGTLIVIDHVAEDGTGSGAAQALHRIEPAFVRRDLERAGFEFAGSSNLLHNPDDLRSRSSFDPQVRGRTDKFLYRFRKPGP